MTPSCQKRTAMTPEPHRLHLPDGMIDTPFSDPPALARIGAVVVDEPEDADWTVILRMKTLDAADPARIRRCWLWSHEPFTDATFRWARPHPRHGFRVETWNAHNGRVYLDNFKYLPGGRPVPLVRGLSDLNAPMEDRTIGVAAAMRRWPLIVDGEDRSLMVARSEMILGLHARARARVIGKNWPEGMAEADTRYAADRVGEKMTFLGRFNFNLCFENTHADHLVTEKVWEAIAAGCLPIYNDSPWIRETFPAHSLILLQPDAGVDALLAQIDAMTVAQYIARVNRCRRTMNRLLRADMASLSRRRTEAAIRRFLDAQRDAGPASTLHGAA